MKFCQKFCSIKGAFSKWPSHKIIQFSEAEASNFDIAAF